MYLRGNRRLMPLINTVAVLFIYLFIYFCTNVSAVTSLKTIRWKTPELHIHKRHKPAQKVPFCPKVLVKQLNLE